MEITGKTEDGKFVVKGICGFNICDYSWFYSR